MYEINFYNSSKDSFYSSDDPAKTKGLIGYLRADFGKDGNEFWTTFWDKHPELKSQEFKNEFDAVIETLRKDFLKDRNQFNKMCQAAPDCKIEGEDNSYGMFVQTEHYEYAVRANVNMGTYDMYCYCYDRDVQPVQYLNARRFRDEYGKLTKHSAEVAKETLNEARQYYTDGDRYQRMDRTYTFHRTPENTWFEAEDGTKEFVAPDYLGTFLPDVASSNMGYSKVPLENTLSTLTLKDILKSVELSDVHLVHQDEEMDLATIVELGGKTLTEEGQKEWADVMNARITKIYEGAYGVQLECSDVDAQRLADFSYMLAGYCLNEDYDKWVSNENTQEQNMNL